MEELKAQYREYYWKYGVSPFKDEQNGEREMEGGNLSSAEAMDESNIHGGSLPMMPAAACKGESEMRNCQSSRCQSPGCRLKAMALTAYCHLHILCDPKQKQFRYQEYSGGTNYLWEADAEIDSSWFVYPPLPKGSAAHDSCFEESRP